MCHLDLCLRRERTVGPQTGIADGRRHVCGHCGLIVVAVIGDPRACVGWVVNVQVEL